MCRREYWEIPRAADAVPARLYASDALIQSIKKDKTLEQARNVACLPGILADVLCHAAIRVMASHRRRAASADEGSSRPRRRPRHQLRRAALRTNLREADVTARRRELTAAIFDEVGRWKSGVTSSA